MQQVRTLQEMQKNLNLLIENKNVLAIAGQIITEEERISHDEEGKEESSQ